MFNKTTLACDYIDKIYILNVVLEIENVKKKSNFYPTALKGCQGIVFTHAVRMAVHGKKFVQAVSQKL